MQINKPVTEARPFTRDEAQALTALDAKASYAWSLARGEAAAAEVP